MGDEIEAYEVRQCGKRKRANFVGELRFWNVVSDILWSEEEESKVVQDRAQMVQKPFPVLLELSFPVCPDDARENIIRIGISLSWKESDRHREKKKKKETTNRQQCTVEVWKANTKQCRKDLGQKKGTTEKEEEGKEQPSE